MDLTPELQEAIKTTKERHAVYGDGYLRNAAIMVAIFPDGIKCTTKEEWLHFYFLFMVVLKLVRYTYSLEAGKPHIDSIHDLGMYALMASRIHKDEARTPAPEEPGLADWNVR